MDFERYTIPLRKHHTWKAKPGFKIFVAERGAARFNVPQDWVLRPTEDCLRIDDRPPPDDEASIGFSLLRVPPVDVSVMELLRTAVEGTELDVVSIGEAVDGSRPGLALAWQESRFRDSSGREAFERTCVARSGKICVLITLEFWVDDAPRIVPVWDEVVASLELEKYVTDPARGDVHN